LETKSNTSSRAPANNTVVKPSRPASSPIAPVPDLTELAGTF
jgi:hypothetical protein